MTSISRHAYAEMFGPTTGDRIRLADTELFIEIEKDFAKTLKFNRPGWNVFAEDMNEFDGRPYKGVDLLAAGLPCPPFSIAGKQLGSLDERNLFPAALRPPYQGGSAPPLRRSPSGRFGPFVAINNWRL